MRSSLGALWLAALGCAAPHPPGNPLGVPFYRVASLSPEAGRFSVELGPGDAAMRNGVGYKAVISRPNEGESRSCRLVTLDLSRGKTKDHGVILDAKGRVLEELWAMDVGEDGTLYGAGPVRPGPRDPVSPRLKRQFLNDSCFLVIRGIEP